MKPQRKTFSTQLSARINFASIDEWLSRKFLHRDVSEIVVFLSVLCYALIFSFFTIQKYNLFHAYAWDLGIFNQSFWTTLHSGRLFYSTVEQFIIPSGVFFGTHFSPILFFVLPFYALGSSPQTLVVFQSFILALGAIPLYFFAKNSLNSRFVAVAFSLSYLIYPPLQGVNWFDFHVQAFLPLFFFSTFYFLFKEKWLPYFILVLLSLTVAENVPIAVIFIGLYCFWRFRKQIINSIKTRTYVEPKLLVPVLTIAMALLWIVVIGWIRQTYFPFNTDFTQLYKAVDNWSELKVQGDPMGLPWFLIKGLITGDTFRAIGFDFNLKLLYIVLLFGPLLFLSFRSSITAISLAWLVPALFSNYTPYYVIGDQFPAYVIAFIFLGAVEGVKKRPKPFRLPSVGSYAKFLLLSSVLFALVVSPLSPAMTALENRFPYFSDYHPLLATKHSELLQEIANKVPDGASILTINNIFPHFSGRTDAYAYPLSSTVLRYNGTELDPKLDEYIESLFQKSEYVMTDSVYDSYTSTLIVDRIKNVTDYGLYANSTDGISLYKRNYTGETLTYDP